MNDYIILVTILVFDTLNVLAKIYKNENIVYFGHTLIPFALHVLSKYISMNIFVSFYIVFCYFFIYDLIRDFKKICILFVHFCILIVHFYILYIILQVY